MWSEELQKQTKEFFKTIPIACVKYSGDLHCGVCAVIEGKYIITEHSTDTKYEFDSIEALIEAGWAID